MPTMSTLNARFCQNRSLLSSGRDVFLHEFAPLPAVYPKPVGQVTVKVDGNKTLRFGVFSIVTKPAGCGLCGALASRQFGSCGWPGSGVGLHPGGGADELIAPSVLNSTPADAVVSLDTTVLLMKLTFSASCIDTPPPSQPATLFAITLLVTMTPFQLFGVVGKKPTSVPLICCRRRPPPLPLSALLPMIRLASITSPGPVPSPIPGGQSTSVVVPHSWPLASVRSELAPTMAIPPPLVGSVGLTLWLNRIQLFAIRPLKLTPLCTTPAPSPELRLPLIQLWSSWYMSSPALTVTPPAPEGVPENSASPSEA